MVKELAICAEIETVVSQIYKALADQLPEEGELREIWKEMADDELEHARLLQFAQRLDPKNTFDGFNLDATQLGQLLVQVKEIYDLALINVWDEKESVRMMLELEEEFRQVHIRFAANLKDASMQKMFEKLGKADELHVERLRSYQQRCS